MASCVICQMRVVAHPSCCSDGCRAQADVEIASLGHRGRGLAAKVMTRAGWRGWLPAERRRQGEALDDLRHVERQMRELLGAKLSTAGERGPLAPPDALHDESAAHP